MKRKLVAAVAFVAVLGTLVAGTAALAQGNVPPPYAGLKNPYPWDDAAAQAAGKVVYQQNCLGCHGVTGNGVASADFSSKDSPAQLEAAPDFYFWIVSEGSMGTGMPSFKGSLSETQRWQALTYIWYLGTAPAPPPPSGPPPGGALALNAVKQVAAGQPLIMSAELLDPASKPIAGWPVTFSTREDFFAKALMIVGQATTDNQGVAMFTYVPRRPGVTMLVASYGTLQASATTIVTETDVEFYQASAGIRLPSAGPPVFAGPDSATHYEVGHAPTPALRLPGGLFSWLWLFVFAVVLIYATYFRVMLQVLRIPVAGRTGSDEAKLVPRFALFLVFALALFVTLMIITGPYSHFHLAPY